MKNRKKWLVLPAGIVLILVAFALIFWRANREAAKGCEEFLEAFTEQDGGAAADMLSGGAVGGELRLDGVTGALSSHMSYRVLYPLPAGDGQKKIRVRITNLDFKRLAEESLPEDLKPEDALQAVTDAANSPDAPLTSYDVDLCLVKEKEQWKIRMTGELSNAILGGYPDYCEELAERAFKEAE